MWVKMTVDEVKSVEVGQKIKVNGVETKVTFLYDRGSDDYGFRIDKKVISYSPGWDGCFIDDIVSDSGVESEYNVFERWVD